MRKQHSIATCVGVTLTVCGCHSFSDRTDANQPLPAYWANWDYVDPSIAGPLNTSIDWFAGRIAYKGGDGKYHFSSKPVFTGTPTLKTNTVQSAFEYHSVIDNSFTGSLSFPSLTATPTKNSSIDYEITDVANVIVPDTNVPDRSAIASALPSDFPTTTPVWWVGVVSLSTVRGQQATSAGVAGSITGSGWSVGGNVMNSDNISTYTGETAIVTSPMNAAADAVVAATPPAPQPPPPRPPSGLLAPPAPAPMPIPYPGRIQRVSGASTGPRYIP